jgi:hypothetical protein
VRIYRLVWLLMCTALVVPGLLVGAVVMPAALGVVAISAMVVGAVVAFAVSGAAEPRYDGSRARFVLRGAVLTGLVAAAAPGLAVALDANFLLVALLAALSSPPLVGRYYRWLDSAPRPSGGPFDAALTAMAWASPGYLPVEPAGAVGELRLLSDEELCQRWRTSCVALPAQSSMSTRIGAVEERRQLLDEIERRNPAGYWAWITSDGPRQATLLGHLSNTPDSADRVDWDTLLG